MLSNYLMQATPQIEAVIFDLDDTLISWAEPEISWPEYLAPMMQRAATFLSENGAEIDAIKFGVVFGRTVRQAWQTARDNGCNIAVSLAGVLHQTLEQLDIDPDSIDIQALMRAFDWTPMPGVKPYGDTHSVLAELKRRGYKIGLITNAFQPMWMRDTELEHDGLLEFFDARITSGDTGFMKPHPAIYWRMMGMLDVTPDRAMFIGDSPNRDIAGANRSGMVSVMIDPPHLDKVAKSAEETPDYTITTLTELLTLPPFTIHNS